MVLGTLDPENAYHRALRAAAGEGVIFPGAIYEAETVQARGKPAEILVEASQDADLIIVGGRKLNRVQRLVLRSVTSAVVHDAACDVLVVR